MPSAIRPLTADDADWVLPLIQPVYRGALTLDHMALMLTDPAVDTVALGDPDVPVYIRLIHYQPEDANLPFAVTGPMTHLADLHPLSLNFVNIDQQISALRPIVQRGLAAMLAKGHGPRRVWASLPEPLAQAFKRNLFPAAVIVPSHPRIITMSRLVDAHAAVL